MGVANQLRSIDNHFAVVNEFPMYAKTPLVIGESDPEGCAACGVTHYPQNGYRNGTMFPTYTALQIARTYELADLRQVNLLGAVSWAFLFEDQPYFDGFRDLATNGIAKPVLNTFRMLGQMSGDRVQAVSSAGLPVEEIRDKGVRGAPDISALAARSPRSATVLIWNYHDDDLPAPAAPIRADASRAAGRARHGHALPHRRDAQQLVLGLAEDGLAAEADAGAVRRTGEGQRAAGADAGASGHDRRRRPRHRDVRFAAQERVVRQGDLVGQDRGQGQPLPAAGFGAAGDQKPSNRTICDALALRLTIKAEL